MEIFTSLSQGNNIQGLVFLAVALKKSGDSIGSLSIFTKIKRLEPAWITNMDYYGMLLQEQGKYSALVRLSGELLDLSKHRAESWLVQAMCCEMKSAHVQALSHIDHALQLNNRHLLAHQLKGRLLLEMQKPGEASLSFRNAYRISRDISNYEGLVRCYIALGKQLEATSTAKEALALLPHSARAVCLAGVVMKENPSLQTKVIATRFSLNLYV